MLCFFAILALLAFYQAGTVTSLQKSLADIQAEKQQYAKILNEIKRIEQDKKVLMTRIEIIKKLKESSSLTVHVMDEVANLTPPRRMWLKGLSQTGNQLRLSGMALDNQTVAKYMDDLGNSSYVQNVNLASASMEKYADRNLKLFSISCIVMVPDTNKDDKKIK